MRVAKLVLLLICCFFAGPLAALTLTWQDCIRAAVDNNTDLKASIASLRATMSQEGVAEGGFFPTVNYNGSWGRATDSAGDDTASTTHAADLFISKFLLNQNIFNGFQDIEKWRQAKANTRASLAALQITKAQLSYDLKQAYESYIYARAFQKLTSDIIQRRKENLRIVELRFQSGRENKGSVLYSQANLNQAKFDDLQARDIKEVARVQLRKALGFDESSEIDVFQEIPLQTWSPKLPDFSTLMLRAPDYVQAEAQTDAAVHGVDIAKSAFFPQANLTGEWGTQAGDFFPRVPYWKLGVNINLSILNGGRDYSTVRGAVATKVQNQNQQTSVGRQDLINLRQNYINLIEAIEQLKVNESFREAASIRAEIARKKYNNGLLTFDEWDIIETDLITRQKNYLQSLQTRVLAEAAWEQAQGVGVIP